ncbi:MAG: hypothetical protein LBE35_07035 [Clostridiales bacterium]|jgi:hypothetical protein|nr:hypothetical protein [Clostridiales bacterium]
MNTVQTLEGYYKSGGFYTYDPLPRMPRYGRVLITLLEPQPLRKSDTWSEFDRLVDEIDEKLDMADFPRCDLGRPLVIFDEV